MRPERWRLFVAADLTDAKADEVIRALSPLRDRHPQVRWTPAPQLHLTMVFLGATPPARVAALSDAIAGVAARWRPFPVVMGEGGGVIGPRGSVAWLRVDQGREHVARLSRELDAAMATGFYARSEPRPHLTVGRAVDEATLADLRAAAPAVSLRWTVDNVVLFRSHTGPRGSNYEELSRHHFAGLQPAAAPAGP